MSKILHKLEHKETKLKAELSKETNERKRKNINIMLKVIAKQQEKGKKLLKKRMLMIQKDKRKNNEFSFSHFIHNVSAPYSQEKHIQM